MASATFEDHPTDPDKMIMRKPHLDIEGPLHVVCRCPACKQAQQDEPVAWMYICDGDEAHPVLVHTQKDWTRASWWHEVPLYTTPQPKQEQSEPVGWIDSKGNMICTKINESCKPLYTTPSKREWVGLTKEDIDYLGIHTTDTHPEDFIRYVEAKLKEKNNG